MVLGCIWAGLGYEAVAVQACRKGLWSSAEGGDSMCTKRTLNVFLVGCMQRRMSAVVAMAGNRGSIKGHTSNVSK